MSAKKSKKLTKVEMFGKKFNVNVDDLWNDLLSKSFESQLETIADIHHFAYHVDWLGISKLDADKFFEAYRRPGAIKARKVAIQGTTRANHGDAIDILHRASECAERGAKIAAKADSPEESLAYTSEAQETDLLCLGARLAEIAGLGDYKTLEQMARILKRCETPPDKKARGGEYAEIGQMFRKFCQLHIELRGLPTKKKLREACGIGSDSDEMERARKMMVKLGLDELPQAAPHSEK